VAVGDDRGVEGGGAGTTTQTGPTPPEAVGYRIRDSASTASISPMGQTAAPIWGGMPGDQPGDWWSAGSQAWRTLAAMDMTEPNTGLRWGRASPPLVVADETGG
jgi:hypothetical protein